MDKKKYSEHEKRYAICFHTETDKKYIDYIEAKRQTGLSFPKIAKILLIKGVKKWLGTKQKEMQRNKNITKNHKNDTIYISTQPKMKH